ncbi:MAG: nucleotidyl transferase AbiEii/AbiGii toxin family protein [Prevotella sp.]|nr:nucleotidyl transferase AbiEii/AbiGii toxin family protein [Prevotella sp.]
MATKNYGVSNKAKLLNITRQTKGQTYMQVLMRFIQERFLYRLSVSEYREHFFLKGGALLYAHERFNARPTMDMDFMGDRIDRDKENIRQAFRAICAIPCEEDGVTFDCGEGDVTVEDIALEREYNGVCVHLTAHLDTIVQPISMDVGFGDVIIPEPVDLDYPLLLEDLPEVNVAAYSLETVVAEKFQTMIDRAESNSRMKDFFDVYTILRSGKVDMAVLEEAVREVFANRGTEYMEGHPLFAEAFVASEQRQTMWRAFLRKMKYPVALEFAEVMEVVSAALKPMWERMAQQR